MFYEKLILNEKENIFINEDVLGRLQKRQVQGIRTIYEQYKNKKPGIILNDPPLTGVTDEVVLFLKAVRHTHDKPMIILSSSAQYWNDRFCHWPQGTNENVICCCTKPTAGLKVYINSIMETPQLTGPSYGVAVVDTEHFNPGLKKELENIKADFKIIIISKDLMMDFSTFTAIHSWLAPTENKVIEKYLNKLNDLKNTTEKAFLINCIFEGVVYRRNINGECNHEKNRHSNLDVEKQQIKNKDHTRTKIKRSRKAVHISSDTLNKSCSYLPSLVTNGQLVDAVSSTRCKSDKSDLVANREIGSDKKRNTIEFTSHDTPKDNDNTISDLHVDLDEIIVKRKKKNVLVYSDEEDSTTSEPKELDSPPTLGSGEARESPEINGGYNKNTEELYHSKNVYLIMEGFNNGLDACIRSVKDDIKTGSNTLLSNADKSISQEVETNIDNVPKPVIQDTSLVNSQFDAEMKYLEDQTVKKFKGSLLDSLF